MGEGGSMTIYSQQILDWAERRQFNKRELESLDVQYASLVVTLTHSVGAGRVGWGGNSLCGQIIQVWFI